MRRNRNEPARFARAPVGRFTQARFGEMQAVGPRPGGELGVIGYEHEQVPLACDSEKRRGKPCARCGFARADDDEASAGQGPGRGGRVRQPFVVGQEHQRREVARVPAGSIEMCRRPCQSAAREAIAHPMPSVGENLASILARIDAVRKAALAPAPRTQLIAVSKTHDAGRIRPALEAGHRIFGENRVQEALGKWPALRHDFPDVELHLVGALQSNKTAEAVSLFDAIHSLDRPKLAHALKAEIDRSGRRPALFIQVNTGEEPQKAGASPAEAPSLIALSRDTLGLPVRGLMCIPPLDQEPGPHFALLRKIATAHQLPLLSMGMSDDFETAVRFGATHVRVGTAIFGERKEAAAPR
jgi:pyridoxal phosphate enzyme (YggS family)